MASFTTAARGGHFERLQGTAAVLAFLVCMTACAQDQRPDMQLLPLDGGALEYQVLGEGPPVLLIHGGLIAGMPQSFLTQPALSGFKLIVYHRRGYAGSAPENGPVDGYITRHAADAVALLQALDIDRAHIFGHSSGGTIAIQMAFDHPEFVQSLVLLEPAIPGYIQNSVPPEAASALAKAAESGDVAGALDIFMGDVAGQPEWRTRFPGTVIKQTEKDALAFFTWEGPAIGAWMAQQPRGAQQEVPVLYVSGTRSPVPRAYVDFVREWFPDTETLVIQGVSHGLHAEDPQSTAEGMASFLREH